MSAALVRKLRQADERLRSGEAMSARLLCEQVLRVAPRNPDALYLLGVAHIASGNPQGAVVALTQALATDPRNGAALENLGLAHLMLGQFVEAQSALAKAAEHPNAPGSVFMRLGIAILEQGRASDALPMLRKALSLEPKSIDGLLNLGRALASAGEIAAAREQFQAALALAPQCADAAFNLGVLAMQQGQTERAREHFLAALKISPDYAAAHRALAGVCLALSRAGEALRHLRAVIAADPADAQALATLAQALYEVGQLDEAEATARRAIGLDPLDPTAYATLANRLLLDGEIGRAIETLDSGYARTKSGSLLGTLTFQFRNVCDWERWRAAWNEMAPQIGAGAAMGSPFWLLCEPTTAQQQLDYTRRWAAARFENILPLEPPARVPTRTSPRLRIGYLSSDLHQHATAYLIADVLERHDRDRFEIFAYSYGPDDGSPMRRRLQAACEHFIDIARDPDDVAARRIQGDALDLLIDLKGYTLGDRLTIMARRPCETQATWLGYPGTTGSPVIDYVIADPIVIPPDAEPAYSERVVRMPHCYQPNDRKRIVATTLARADYGLPERAFVFCCFNQSYKISPEVFSVWMRLLRATADGVLWIFESNPLARHNLRQFAGTEGVAAERLVFAPRLPNPEHLARYRVADLALDTFPYTSHTTLSDALWCGCPTLGLCGNTFASRVSGSLLTAAGLPDLVTYSLADYERLALELVSDRYRLEDVRARVAKARDDSPLFDSAAFTRDLEKLYDRMVGAHRAHA